MNTHQQISLIIRQALTARTMRKTHSTNTASRSLHHTNKHTFCLFVQEPLAKIIPSRQLPFARLNLVADALATLPTSSMNYSAIFPFHVLCLNTLYMLIYSRKRQSKEAARFITGLPL